MSPPSRGAHPYQTTSQGSACLAARIVNDFSVASTKLSSLLGHLVKTCQLLQFISPKSVKQNQEKSKQILKERNITQKEFAALLGISPVGLYQQIKTPSYPTLEKWVAVLNIPMWQLFASPEEVAANTQQEELKQARAQRSGVGGGGLVGVVRVGCEIYTADTVQQLRAIVERLERDEGTKK